MLVLRTFSKIYGLAGLRVGYAVGPGEVCAAMAKLRRPFDLTHAAPRTRRSRASTTGSELARRRALNRRGLERLYAILRGHGLEPAPDAVGNFLYLETGEAGGALRALPAGGRDRPPARGFGAPEAIRISVGTPEEHEFFADALRRC